VTAINIAIIVNCLVYADIETDILRFQAGKASIYTRYLLVTLEGQRMFASSCEGRRFGSGAAWWFT